MDYAEFDDQTLLHLIVRTHADALSELYRRYGRLVYSVAFNALNSRELAEEVTQDTFLRVWQHAGSYQIGQGRVSTWLASIARHRAIDILRRQQVRPEGHSISLDDFPFFDPADHGSVEKLVEQAGEQRRVQAALAQLPAEQRQVLALAYYQGLTQEQIAQELGQPLGTVKTRIRLGMQKLRGELIHDSQA